MSRNLIYVFLVFPLLCFCSLFFFDCVFAESYTASISTSGVVTVNAISDGSSASVGVDNLTVTSTCPSGYNITIEGPSDTNLYLNGDSSNNTSGTYIAHSTGTPTNPVSIIGSNLGTWGYSTSSSTGSGTFIGLTNTATALYSKNSASASSGDSIPIYYGASVPLSIAPGTYEMPSSGAITYYLTRSDDCISYQVSFNANGGSGTMNTQRIYEGVATSLTANTFTAPTGKVFKEWNTSADGTGISYKNAQSVTDIAAIGSTMPLYAIWVTDPCAGKIELYDLVACRSKGTQSQSDLQAIITEPISSNPFEDTSNSGVYEYDASTFGASSDASNDHTIYYYRGILDSDLDGTSATYGSNGDGAYYPNYVKLGDTCWRIVRTTGSGGVKMIYNGLYSSGITANSCANLRDDARTITRTFGLKGNSQSSYWYRNINRVGYTFNNDSSIQDSTTSTSVDTVFGSNSNYSSTNTADSNIKDYIENTWFSSADGIGAYEGILEPSAGYCNDRTLYSDSAGTTSLSSIKPYSMSEIAYFGSASRNLNPGGKPSLTCTNNRNIVDLYTTASASNGNKQLNKPVALLTSDEAALAGGGYSNDGGTVASTYSSNYSYNTYLRSGAYYWLLSPYFRNGNSGHSFNFNYSFVGINADTISNGYGVRPVISLQAETTPSSGSGTAVDPWVIEEPGFCDLNDCMQDMTLSKLATMMPNTGDSATLYDARDEQEYTVAKLADGNYWMTKNLNLAGGTTLSYEKTNITSKTFTYTLPASSTTFPTSGNAIRLYNSGSTNCANSSPCYSYYNESAAVLFVNVDSHGDICPANWRLPTSGELSSLKTYYTTGASLTASPFNAVYSGRFSDSQFVQGGTGGEYLSSTFNDRAGHYYYLSFTSSSASITSRVNNSGQSIRCTFKNT